MMRLYSIIKIYFADTKAATAIEYGMIAAGVALAIGATILAFGGEINEVFSNMEGSMQEVDTMTTGQATAANTAQAPD